MNVTDQASFRGWGGQPGPGFANASPTQGEVFAARPREPHLDVGGGSDIAQQLAGGAGRPAAREVSSQAGAGTSMGRLTS